MSLYDVVAASQQGLAFDNLARRFRATEIQAALAVEELVSVVMRSIDAHLSQPGKAADLLERLADPDLDAAYAMSTLPSDAVVREQGLTLLAEITKSRDIASSDIFRAANRSGLGTSDIERMLPVVAVLTLSAIRQRARQQVRELLAQVWNNPARAARTSDPFRELAAFVRNPQQADDRGLFGSGLMANLFTRRPANATDGIGA